MLEVGQRLGVSGHRVSNQLGVDQESIKRKVAHIVTKAVVATVQDLTVERILLLCTSSNSSTWNSILDKSNVVGSAVKWNQNIVQSLGLVVVNVKVLQLLGSNRIESIGGVVHLVLGIVVGSNESLFFGSPPCKSHLVVDLELGQLLGNFQKRDSSRAIVVDTRTSSDTVGVSAKHNNVVTIAVNSLCNNVQGLDGGNVRVNQNGSRQRTLGQQRNVLLAVLLGNTNSWSNNSIWWSTSKTAPNFSVLVVVDDGSQSTQLSCIDRFLGESANTSLDQNNRTTGVFWEVRQVASVVSNNNKRASDKVLVRSRRTEAKVGKRLRLGAVNQSIKGIGLADGSWQSLDRNVVVTVQLVDLLLDVVNCGPMTFGTNDSCRMAKLLLRLGGNLVQSLCSLSERFFGDESLKSGGVDLR
ncbi:hypothetical protein OGAPHI_006924 [Ogataea philodendri]|uniref:Uncharacterized protein n=1 Tax=Ogataea philodendri TaxID=1378263 RepID=A0A9P8NU04_9ASCO|nr:uncharacterized protein OGAPHI_006924 [Ogataea philodendri]KAH3660338.1 hypothetical protein OGAPHI_006924 [Ogataea philodendri]